MQFLFADHALDADRRELRRGADHAIEPQVFDLLVYLLQNRDRVVSKDDLLASVWGGRIVSDSTLTSRVNAVGKAVGDSGKDQRLIRTIARKGLRFVGSVCTQANGEAPIWVGRTWQPPFRLLSARRWRRSGSITRTHGRITRWAASICSRGVSKISLAEFELALRLNPNFSMAQGIIGLAGLEDREDLVAGHTDASCMRADRFRIPRLVDANRPEPTVGLPDYVAA